MDAISPMGSILSRIRELTNSQPSPSMAEIVASPEPMGLESLSASEFTTRYEMAILARTLYASADQALALIQAFDHERMR